MFTRIVGRPIALAALFTALLLVLGISIALIAMQLFGHDKIVSEAECRLGLSDKCLSVQLEESRDEISRLQSRKKKLEAIYDRLASLDHASESFVVFYFDRTGPTVVTGLQYKSLIEPGQFDEGWCYIQLSQSGEISQNINIARMNRDGTVRPASISGDTLSAKDLTNDQVAAARQRCRWDHRTS